MIVTTWQSHSCNNAALVHAGFDTPHGPKRKQFIGITYESKLDKFSTNAVLNVTTLGEPNQMHTFVMRTSHTSTGWCAILKQRTATLLWLTQGTYRNLSGIGVVSWQHPHVSEPCVVLRTQVLSYNSEADVFLLKDGWQKAMNRHGAQMKAIRRAISFDYEGIVPDTQEVPSQAPAQSVQAPTQSVSNFTSVDTTQVVSQAADPGITATGDMLSLQGFEAELRTREANVLLCGAAGTGKSHVMKSHIRTVLHDMYGEDSVWVTATTGMAALGVEGSTLHSMAGVGLGKSTAESVAAGIYANAAAYRRWMVVKAIVIEECSMLDAVFFDKLHEVACIVRPEHCEEPFAGVRMILVGDFAQLPPMADLHKTSADATGILSQSDYHRPAPQYVFESAIWAAAKFMPYHLNHCWRYDVHSDLGKLLTKLRVSEKLDDNLFDRLEGMLVQDEAVPDSCVRLVTKKAVARSYSIPKLHNLKGPDVDDHIFFGVDTQGANRYVNVLADDSDKDPPARLGLAKYTDHKGCPRSLYRSMVCDSVLRLRVGAKVLCTKSLDENIKTSAIGTIVGWAAMGDRLAA